MKKVILLSSVLLIGILTAVTTGEEKPVNYINDGNVTENEAIIMDQEWCSYNAGRDFAEGRCE